MMKKNEESTRKEKNPKKDALYKVMMRLWELTKTEKKLLKYSGYLSLFLNGLAEKKYLWR